MTPRAYVVFDGEGRDERLPVMGTRFHGGAAQLRVMVQGPVTLPIHGLMSLYGMDDRLVARGHWRIGSEPGAVAPRDYVLADLTLPLTGDIG